MACPGISQLLLVDLLGHQEGLAVAEVPFLARPRDFLFELQVHDLLIFQVPDVFRELGALGGVCLLVVLHFALLVQIVPLPQQLPLRYVESNPDVLQKDGCDLAVRLPRQHRSVLGRREGTLLQVFTLQTH